MFARLCVYGRNRSHPSAAVGNRPQPSATVRVRARMAVPMVSSAKGVTFGGFKSHVALFRVAGVALRRDIQTCFVTCGKSEDALHFSWQAQHFGDHHRDFTWQAQHFRRVMLHVFCESHCQGWPKW